MKKNIKDMKVYHGSTERIEEPRLLQVSRKLDFGEGFYTTSDLGQAKRWAEIKRQRNSVDSAVVSVYEFEEHSDLKIKKFCFADGEWLDFIMKHRMGKEDVNVFDVIAGPVANDTLYETLSLYERGILSYEETIVRLRVHELTDQITFKTKESLRYLTFDGVVLL